MPQATATQQLAEVLNKQLANWSILFFKLHNYHWFVKGPHFFVLHETFEKLYNEAAQHIDELAERMLMIKHKPLATMRDYLQQASITEATGNEDARQMVRQINDDFQTMIEELKQGIRVAENEGDDSTADMLIGIRTSLEKHAWMLRTFIEQ